MSTSRQGKPSSQDAVREFVGELQRLEDAEACGILREALARAASDRDTYYEALRKIAEDDTFGYQSAEEIAREALGPEHPKAGRT